MIGVDEQHCLKSFKCSFCKVDRQVEAVIKNFISPREYAISARSGAVILG